MAGNFNSNREILKDCNSCIEIETDSCQLKRKYTSSDLINNEIAGVLLKLKK